MKKNKKTAVRFVHATFTDDVLEKIGRAGADIYKHPTLTNSYDIKFDNLLDFEGFADDVERVTGERPNWTQCYSVEVAA